MRLTLRTLLAYLDNTLEPQDAEILRQKVEQSGFATQLVQRIRGSLKDSSLSAPAPDSVHPIEEPNMMSNYLDSTLSPEQIAEIEKACLDSLPHLAEAAACHQILTMVLGRPAEVSDRLRERIISMVDKNGKIVERHLAPIAGRLGEGHSSVIAGEIGPRFSGVEVMDSSGVTIESEETPIENESEAIFPGGDAVVDWGSDQAVFNEGGGLQDVKPVGVDDSGVFQAATKLREQSQQFADAGTALDGSPVLAAEQSGKGVGRSDLLSGKTDSLRVTPWLISIALVGVLIFAIFKIFAPLMGPQVTQIDEGENVAQLIESDKIDSQDGGETQNGGETQDGGELQDASVESSDASIDASNADVTEENTVGRSAAAPEMLPAPEPIAELAEPESAADLTESALTDNAVDASTTDRMATADAVEVPEAIEVAMEDSDGPPLPPGMDAERIASLPESATPGKDTTETIEPEGTNPAMVAAIGATQPSGAREGAAIAQLVSDNALVAMRDGDSDWSLLAAESIVNVNQTVVCVPEYRAEFALAGDQGGVQTLVGPAEIRWIEGQQSVNFEVGYGKGIISLVTPGSSVRMSIGEWMVVVETESNDAVIAYDVMRYRELGSDPMVPENHSTRVVLTSVMGDFAATYSNGASEIPGGSQLVIDLAKSDDDPTEAIKPDQLPAWIDPEVDTGTLESEAASDLLELVRSDGSGSLLLSLRVALGFRRNEVAALSGKAMLAMGDASAYFGIDGLLSNPKQRLYWSSHLDAVRALVDRTAKDAAAVRAAIAGQNAAMDVVDGDTLFRILTGYSQDQLKTGGDAELVAGLESGSLPVRVLAAEHLRDISGTTLFFKPEEEVASRREEVIKKWKVRLRKESIRYPDAE